MIIEQAIDALNKVSFSFYRNHNGEIWCSAIVELSRKSKRCTKWQAGRYWGSIYSDTRGGIRVSAPFILVPEDIVQSVLDFFIKQNVYVGFGK